MRVVLTLVARDEPDVVDAQIAYHLNVGVDHVIAVDVGSDEVTRQILDAYESEKVLTVAPADGVVSMTEARARMRRMALTDHEADWIIESDADEFWWPRGPNLKEVLEPIPPRYTAVQALVRVFLPRPATESFFYERLTVRPGLQTAAADPEPLPWALRSVYRVRGGTISEYEDRRSVPLRAWYPIEVLRYPLRSPDQAKDLSVNPLRGPRSRIEAALENGSANAAQRYADLVVGDGQLRQGLADGSLVEDVRLRDALRVLRMPSGSGLRFRLPHEAAVLGRIPTPTVVEDALHAVECSAIGEVDLTVLDGHIRDLESRISVLEQRLSQRVLRRLSRVVGSARL